MASDGLFMTAIRATAAPAHAVRPLDFLSPGMLEGRWAKGGINLPKEPDKAVTVAAAESSGAGSLSRVSFTLDDGSFRDWKGSYDAIASSTAPRTITFKRYPRAAEMDAKEPLWARQQVDASRSDRTAADGDPLVWKLVLTAGVSEGGVLVLSGLFYPGEISIQTGKSFSTGSVTQEARVIGQGTGRPVEFIRDIGCDATEVDVPADLASTGGRLLAGNEWRLAALVTPAAGLQVKDVQLGTRYMASSMGVSTVQISTPSKPGGALEEHLVHLTPSGEDADGRARLVDLYVPPDAGSGSLSATYAIDHIPAGTENCVMLTLTYSFAPVLDPVTALDGRCEPFGVVRCARFIPQVSYTYRSPPRWPAGRVLVRTTQELHFAIDQRSANASILTSDYDWAFTQVVKGLFSPVKVVGGNPNIGQNQYHAIVNGSAGEVDNFHQTWKATVEEPTLFDPGCPECVHIHWRWSKASNSYSLGRIILGAFPEGGEGLPIIPAGSTQSVNVTIEGSTLVYAAESQESSDSFFAHGGWFSPEEPLTLVRLETTTPAKGVASYKITDPTGSAVITRIAVFVPCLRTTPDSPNIDERVNVEAGDTVPALAQVASVKCEKSAQTVSSLQHTFVPIPATHAKWVRLTWTDNGQPVENSRLYSDESFEIFGVPEFQ